MIAPAGNFARCVLAAALVVFGPTASHAYDQIRSDDLPSQQKQKPAARKPDAAAKKPAEQAKPKPSIPPREAFTAAELQAAAVAEIPGARFWADTEKDFVRALPTASGPWLALSSGGADGAFGAGVVTGLSVAGKRPEFAMVSGVSTGALMAPFVFLGDRYNDRLRAAYINVTAADIFELGGKGESFFDTWPLKDLIAKRVTPELLADVAAEHARGRRLFVLTTNLDAERPVAWDMGAIASKGGPKALKLFRDVLLAATSIPGAFPPVLIDVEAGGHKFQEMHSDGGLNNQFFVAPEPLLSPTSAYRLPASEIFVIINTRLTPDFQVTERDMLPILGRAVSTGVKTLTRVMADRAYAAARRSNVPFSIATISPNFAAPSRGAFDPDYMKALFEFGSEQARSGVAFRNEP